MLFLKHILLFQIITTLKYYNEKKPIIGIYGNPNPEEDYNIGESDYVPQTYINIFRRRKRIFIKCSMGKKSFINIKLFY